MNYKAQGINHTEIRERLLNEKVGRHLISSRDRISR
jgi:hypothetical protein